MWPVSCFPLSDLWVVLFDYSEMILWLQFNTLLWRSSRWVTFLVVKKWSHDHTAKVDIWYATENIYQYFNCEMLWIIHPGSSLPLPLDPVESNVIDVFNFASDVFFFVRPSVESHFSLMYYLLFTPSCSGSVMSAGAHIAAEKTRRTRALETSESYTFVLVDTIASKTGNDVFQYACKTSVRGFSSNRCTRHRRVLMLIIWPRFFCICISSKELWLSCPWSSHGLVPFFPRDLICVWFLCLLEIGHGVNVVSFDQSCQELDFFFFFFNFCLSDDGP